MKKSPTFPEKIIIALVILITPALLAAGLIKLWFTERTEKKLYAQFLTKYPNATFFV